MSTILKALKRLEHEEHQRPERSLRERVATAPEPRRALPVALVAASVFAVGLAIGAAALFLWPGAATEIAAERGAPGAVASGPERSAEAPLARIREEYGAREPVLPAPVSHVFDPVPDLAPQAYESPVEVVELARPPRVPEPEPEPAAEPAAPAGPGPGEVRPAATAFRARTRPVEQFAGLPGQQPHSEHAAPEPEAPAPLRADGAAPPAATRPPAAEALAVTPAPEPAEAAEPAPASARRAAPLPPDASPLERMARAEAAGLPARRPASAPVPAVTPLADAAPEAAPPRAAAAEPPPDDPVPAPATAAPAAGRASSAPDVVVARTHWHPRPDKRVAFVQLGGESVRIQEGDSVGPFLVTEIEPSGVVFDREGVEVRRRISGP